MECKSGVGCPPLEEIHKDFYKDDGVRDKAMRSLCRSSALQMFFSKKVLLWALGAFGLLVMTYGGWLGIQITSADDTFVKKDSITSTLEKMNHSLFAIQSDIGVIKTTIATITERQRQEAELHKKNDLRDRAQEKEIHAIKIDIERVKNNDPSRRR